MHAYTQAYTDLQQLQKAAECYEACVALRSDLGDVNGLTIALKKKGCALYACGNLKQAVDDLESFTALVSQNTDRHVFLDKDFEESRRDEVDACCVLGRAHLRMGNVVNACDALKRALALTHESGDRHGEAKCLEAFGHFYRDLGIMKRAVDHFERALATCIELQVGYAGWLFFFLQFFIDLFFYLFCVFMLCSISGDSLWPLGDLVWFLRV